MEFDKELELEQNLKKSRAGVSLKQSVLVLRIPLASTYDFTKPFRMCFRITYVK